MSQRNAGFTVRKLPQRGLHTRTIIRDGRQAFVGSQSLRQLELDGRREVGIIIRDSKAVTRLMKTLKTFRDDWVLKDRPADTANADLKQNATSAVDVAKKVAKSVTKDLTPVAAAIQTAVQEMAGMNTGDLNHEEIEEAVKG